MKQLTCEMCGSNDLLKQDGVFVCQSCGCKYSVEEAKKMMVEVTVDVSGNAAALLERAFTFLEESDWDRANEYCEKVLDINPKCAEAYLGKLMAELKVRKQEALKDYFKPFDDNNNYKKAVSFADENLWNKLRSYSKQVEESYNVKKKRLEMLLARYKKLSSMQPGESESDYDRRATYQLNQLNQTKNNLTNLLAIFPKLSQELISAEQTIKSKEAQVKALQDELDTFYIFNVMLKQENKRKIRTLQDEIQRLTDTAAQLKNQCLGYSSIDLVHKNLALINAEIEKLNHNLSPEQEGLASLGSLKSIVAELTSATYRPFAQKHIEYKRTLDHIALKQRFKQAKIGELMFFGTGSVDKKQPIVWLVLEVKQDKVLLLSLHGLFQGKYNNDSTPVTWETCTLRHWLNNEFFNTAFSATEQAVISTVTVPAEQDPQFNTNPGNETHDKVFLLSFAEYRKYRTVRYIRSCDPGHYSSYYSSSYEFDSSVWWLRSPGEDQYKAACIHPPVYGSSPEACGTVTSRHVDSTSPFVRPAMWIDISGI